MKKVLLKSVMAALAVLLSLNAQAHDVEIDGIYYNLNSTTKEATVTYKGSSSTSKAYSGSVVIPASIVNEGTTYVVTSIGYSAFSGCSNLTSIAISSSVKSIDRYAFENCSGLTTIILPSSVTAIGANAFRGCQSLNSINIPNNVPHIYDYTFCGCI